MAQVLALLSRPGSKRYRLKLEVLTRLWQHEEAGELPTSARFIYYELKQNGIDTGTHVVRKPDQDVIDAISHLRKVGLVPWDWIADETRYANVWPSAKTIVEYLTQKADSARIDLWGGKPPFILCETRGVAGALRATAARYLCPIASTNGQVGGFLRTDIMPHLQPEQRIIYFGDWNPAGSDIEQNVQRTLAEKGDLIWQRLAVTPDLATSYGLPPKPGTDRRYKDGNPHISYECEALGQSTLARILTEWLDAEVPESLDRVLEREREQRDAVKDHLGRFKP